MTLTMNTITGTKVVMNGEYTTNMYAEFDKACYILDSVEWKSRTEEQLIISIKHLFATRENNPKCHAYILLHIQALRNLRETMKYRSYREERLAIFETLMTAGVSKEQLESTSQTFNALANGDADVMMGLWRQLADGMTN